MLLVHADDKGVDAFLDELTSLRVAQLEEALWTDQWDRVLHRAELWAEPAGGARRRAEGGCMVLYAV